MSRSLKRSEILNGCAIGLAVHAPVCRYGNRNDEVWEKYTVKIFRLLGAAIQDVRRYEK